MGRMISVHEYVLKPEVSAAQFEQAVQQARARGLLQLPGLVDYALLRGLRGARQDHYAALWIYASREAWEKLWGPAGQPISKQDYPKKWKIWENEILAPLLDRDPDQIRFTSYEEL